MTKLSLIFLNSSCCFLMLNEEIEVRQSANHIFSLRASERLWPLSQVKSFFLLSCKLSKGKLKRHFSSDQEKKRCYVMKIGKMTKRWPSFFFYKLSTTFETNASSKVFQLLSFPLGNWIAPTTAEIRQPISSFILCMFVLHMSVPSVLSLCSQTSK